MKLCYIEDFMGGTICYENQKEYFLLLDNSSKICFEGTKEEMEREHLGHEITEDNISYVRGI